MKSELIVKVLPKSSVSEDIRTIRTNLEFSLSSKDDKVVMVTSPSPNEGKTFISVNLAIALAQNGKKVLLIDCDLRRGRTHKIFKLLNEKGLSNLIVKSDDSTVFEDYVKKTEVKNLFLLSSGVIPPNPSELLSSKKFEKILDEFKKVFDYIILDSTPVNGLPDSLILSKLSDKTIIITKYGSTSIDALIDAKKSLENVDTNIAGVVINKIPKSKNKYGSYYYGYLDD